MPPLNLISKLVSQFSSQSVLASGGVGASRKGEVVGSAPTEKDTAGNPFSVSLLLRRSTCSLTSIWLREISESRNYSRIFPAVFLNLSRAPPPLTSTPACTE